MCRGTWCGRSWRDGWRVSTKTLPKDLRWSCLKELPMRLRIWLIVAILSACGGEPARADDKTTAKAVRIEFNQRVPMRDGVELSADVYRPAAQGRYPVILLRTPYNKVGGGKAAVTRFESIVARGYVVVNQDVRGRGDSDGVFEPWRRRVRMATTRSNGAPPSPGATARSGRPAAPISATINGSPPCSNRRTWRPWWRWSVRRTLSSKILPGCRRP